MVAVDMGCSLDAFREFMIISCCRSFIPEELLENSSVFPERSHEQGAIYVEAQDKVTITRIREIDFVYAEDVIGITYNSKSGSTKLRWEKTSGRLGRLTGEASMRSLVHMAEAGIIRAPEAKNRPPTRRGRPGRSG